VRRAVSVQLLEDLLLEDQVFRHRLDHQISLGGGLGQRRGGMQAGQHGCRRSSRQGTTVHAPFQLPAGRGQGAIELFWAHIVQPHLQALQGTLQGDLCPHCPCPHHADTLHRLGGLGRHACFLPWYRLLVPLSTALVS